MNYIEPKLETALTYLDMLKSDTKPDWGKMSAQEMVEHLSDTLRIASGKDKFPLATPEKYLEKSYEFLMSESPLQRELNVSFAPEERTLRHDDLSDAIDEFTEEWIAYEEHYENNDQRELHPYFGNLNFAEWQELNKKHLTHHLLQFGLIK
tara:strand:+ start:155906 stop:156358 length:453 start_codon:yes stop_codon:yes gene_type:complete